QEIVNVGALVQRNFLAPEIGDRIKLAVFRHEDRFAFRRRRLIGDVPDGCTRRLREDRWSFAGVAEIDGTDVERFEQGRTGGKFGPHHRVADGLKLVLERAFALQQDQLAVFLESDTDDLVLPIGSADRGSDNADRQHRARDPTLHETPHLASSESILKWLARAHVCVLRQTMLRTAISLGIRPSLKKRSATPCWVMMMSSV